MPFFVEDPRRKPEKWGPVTPGLVAPELRWAWQGLVGAWMLWEGGTPPRDIVNGVPSTFGPTPFTPTVSPHGIGLKGAGGNIDEGILIDASFDFPGKFPINVSGTEVTIIAVFSTNDTAETQAVFALRAGNGWQIQIRSNNLRFTIFGLADYDASIPTAHRNADYKVWGTSFRTDDVYRAFINGLQIGSDVSIGKPGALANKADVGLFSFNDNGGLEDALNGTAVCLLAYDRFLSDIEHHLIAQDPFGPFRMEDIAPWATVAAPGVSQAFRYPYHKNLRAALAG